MNHLTLIIIGFFCGVGVTHSADSLIMELNARKVQAMREASIENEVNLKVCLSGPRNVRR